MKNIRASFNAYRNKKSNFWVGNIMILNTVITKCYYKRRAISNILKEFIVTGDLFRTDFMEVLDFLEKRSLGEELKRKNKRGV